MSYRTENINANSVFNPESCGSCVAKSNMTQTACCKFISCGIIVKLAEDMRTKVVSSLKTLCLSDSLTPCFVCRLLWLFMSQLTVSSTASLFVRRWFVSFCLHFISQADVSLFTRCYRIFCFNVLCAGDVNTRDKLSSLETREFQEE